MRKRFLPVAAAFPLSAAVGFLGTAEEVAACSGDDCDSGISAAAYSEGCPPWGAPGGQECFAACRRASVRCAIACCSGGGPPSV